MMDDHDGDDDNDDTNLFPPPPFLSPSGGHSAEMGLHLATNGGAGSAVMAINTTDLAERVTSNGVLFLVAVPVGRWPVPSGACGDAACAVEQDPNGLSVAALAVDIGVEVRPCCLPCWVCVAVILYQ